MFSQSRKTKKRKFEHLDSNIIKTLDFMEFIHKEHPTKNLVFEKFENRVKMLLSPLSLVTGFSPYNQIVLQYPFLFGSELRKIIYFINTLEFSSALNKFGELVNESKPALCKKMQVLAVVNREELWSNGCTILNTYGKTQVHIKFSFKGEYGFGYGPTNEFFTLMSKEFAKNSRNMWQSDDPKSEFAFKEEIGLLPNPGGNLENFYMFGIFCAKAIQQNVLISMPLSKAFLKLILGIKVQPEDIGYKSEYLKESEDLYDLPFVFPGTSVPLVKNGENLFTNKANLGLYLKRINELIEGELWRDVMTAFNRGFYTISRKGYSYLLTENDLSDILIGVPPKFSYKEVKESIRVYSGFEENDQEIEWLIQIISELSQEDSALFIKFVTGSDVLPVGGIRSLNPAINVTLKPEKELPSASTCANYLKISRYDNKEKLLSDLLTAIRECSSFLLS
jgi:E3 ubiquitin-protein ligase TRIP12